MKITELLKKYRSDIIDKWFEFVISTYPEDTSRFLFKERDQFANPVGATTLKSLKEVFDALVNGLDHQKVKPLIDPIVRIRAVQEFSPAQALSFIFTLKSIIRLILKKDIKTDLSILKELADLELKIDEFCLIAFDIYMGCREQVYKYKANHVKDRTLRLLKKANVLCEVPEVGTDIIPHNVYKNGGFDDK